MESSFSRSSRQVRKALRLGLTAAKVGSNIRIFSQM